jgi:tryptophanyl-tRNA synthetase
MRANYATKGFGYGHAKTAYYELVLSHFEKERALFNDYIENTDKIDEILAFGAEKARKIARVTLDRVRSKVGFYPQGRG